MSETSTPSDNQKGSDDKKKSGSLPGWLNKPIPMPHPFGRGIIWREFHASSSAVMAMAMAFALYYLLEKFSPQIRSATGGNISLTLDVPISSVWLCMAIIMVFLLGTLCGAEEEENGTADFPFRLPIPRWRIFVEKLCGSVLSFCSWVILTLFLDLVTTAFSSNRWIIDGIFGNKDMLQSFAVWAPLLFCFGLVAGTWIGRVVVAAIVGGCSAAAFGWIVSYALSNRQTSVFYVLDSLGWIAILLVCLVALVAAGLRYQLRGGCRRVLAQISGTRSLFWKEWRAKWWMLIALVAGYFVLLALEYFKGDQGSIMSMGTNLGTAILAGLNLVLVAIVLASTFFTRDEHDAARDFLYLLPVSRQEVLRVKIRAFFSQLFVIFLFALIPMFCLTGVKTVLAIGSLSLAAAALAGFVTAILLLHCRTVILTVVGSVVCVSSLLVIFLPDLAVSGQGTCGSS